MASTRTPGITIDSDGHRFLDKRYHGIRIGIRVGSVTQEQAERRLQTEIQRVNLELAERAQPRLLLRDCAARYLAQSRDKPASKQSGCTCAYCCGMSERLSLSTSTMPLWRPSSPSARQRA